MGFDASFLLTLSLFYAQCRVEAYAKGNEMAYEVFEASPQAKARIETQIDTFGITEPSSHHRVKYPFDKLAIGQCFTIPIAEANEVGLRSSAVAAGKRSGGKKFTVIKHREHAIIEVARIY